MQEIESVYEIMRDEHLTICPHCKANMSGDSRGILTINSIDHEFCNMVCASKWFSARRCYATSSSLSMRKVRCKDESRVK